MAELPACVRLTVLPGESCCNMYILTARLSLKKPELHDGLISAGVLGEQ